MIATSWQELSAVFQQVFDLPDGERERCLAELCTGNESLRGEVESLLRAHDLAEHFTQTGQAVTVGELGADALDLAPSRQLGPYTLLSELGQGGMSTVYLAARADDEFDRLVAIKTLRLMGGPEVYERFRAERQVHANLEHPGIARLYGGGTTERGVPYIVMEYIDGGLPIGVYCDEMQQTAEARIGLFLSVCDAVAYAHRNLVVHRDLKPNNILVSGSGEPKLLDFGISKLLTGEGSDWDPTGIGPGPLTPSYASPEQVLGEAITTASDVYSLGLLLFRLLAGKTPVPGSLGERLRILTEETTLPSLEQTAEADEQAPATAAFRTLERGRRQDLEAIVAKALQREPQARYGSVELLAADLRRWQSGLTVSARLPTLAYRFSRWLRRNWLVASFATAVIVTLAGSSIFLAAQAKELAQERDRARAEGSKSERILALLLGLFGGSDPVRAQGEDITVRDLLLDAEPRIDRELATQPRVQAALFEAVGQVFLSLGNLDDAERILNRARDLWEATTWPESSAGTTTLDLLSQVHVFRGGFDQALEALEHGLQLRRAEFGSESLEEAMSLSQVAYIYLLLYRTEEAEATARQALAIFDEQGDVGFESYRIDAQFYVAEALMRQKRRAEAEPLFEELLIETRAFFGANHPKTLNLLGKLADLKSADPNQLDVAERHIREKITAQEHVYEEEDHPKIAVSLDVLAGILARRGKLDEAEEVFGSSLEMYQRLLGSESPGLAVTQGNLGWFLLFRRADPERAQPILQDALRMGEKFFSSDATVLAYPLIGLGRCQTLLGQAELGEPYLRRALAIRRAAHGEEALSVARVELFLGENLAAQGDCGAAEALLLDSKGALEPTGHPDDLSRMQDAWHRFREVCGSVTRVEAHRPRDEVQRQISGEIDAG
ncbi:MAG: serine/threonine-protein kinase [Acidobacteriota bacterium]